MKVSDYIFKKLDRNAREFLDEATIIFNYGKYSAQTVTTPPTWVARNGEFAFLNSSGQNRVYFYASNQWNWIGGGAGGALAAGFEPMVQWNSGGFFAADSGFQYVTNSALLIGTGCSLVFNSNSGANTRAVYTISNTYLEFWLNGEVRLQM